MPKNQTIPNTFRSNRGIAMITALAIISIVGALVLGSIITTQVEMAVARNDASAAQAQYVAQAGMQTYKAALFQNFRWIEGGSSGGGSNLDACTNSLEGGLNFDRTSDGMVAWDNDRIMLTPETVLDVDGDVIGNYTVTFLRDPDNHSRITVQSVGKTAAGGTTRQATATASSTYIIRNSSTLEQAIFAGSGSDMKFVNGNTTIYGGVYIVGDRDNPATEVIQSNGNLQIFNGYTTGDSGNPEFLVSDVRKATNLCAALRVESGTVALGGSTQLGKAENQLLTVAISRGLVDVDLERGMTTECKTNKGICSETGVRPFDIDAPPDFPILDQTPATEFCQAPTWWRTCIQQEAEADGIVIATNGGNTVTKMSPAGGWDDPNCQARLDAAAAAANKTLLLGGTSLRCVVLIDGVEHGFEYVANNPAIFRMFGNVNIRGLNLWFDRAVEYRAESRSADGELQTFAGLSLEKDAFGRGGTFTAMDKFVADFGYGRFPNNVISIIAEGVVELVGNQKDYTAPIYAGDQFRLRGNAQLFGQVIANSFCTTNTQGSCSQAGNPAEIFFVPTGENRPRSYRAVAPTGGLPTFVVEAYELR